MKCPSLTLIFSGAFIGYILFCIYTVAQLFISPPCTEHCISSSLKHHPKMMLYLFTSSMRRPLKTEVTRVYMDPNFDYMHSQDIPLMVNLPQKTRQNGTLFLHVILAPHSSNTKVSFNDLIGDYHNVRTTIKMTEYALLQAKTFNLLGEEDEDEEEIKKNKKSINQPHAHLKTKMAFAIMTDIDIKIPMNDAPIELSKDLRVNQNFEFFPILKYNFLATRNRDLVRITSRTRSMNTTVSYTPISFGKLRLILHIEAAMQNFKQLGFTEKDIDEIKGIFADSNLYLLAGTVCISAMHLLFDFLAVKNDIKFWRSKNSLAGLSTQTLLWQAFSQAVIFLYLLDEKSSLLILIPAGVATVIEFWKMKKILRVEVLWPSGSIPRIRFNWNKCTAAEAKTREFDAESLRYLSYLLYPFVMLGAIYSLLYLPHKGWYSWCIHSLVNGVYIFGFLFMLPQLFINYKLKSVAHLPWKSFMYKAFNTFIDDVFAFIITMPVAHRVACFRDDAVFLIYLYQRWLYPVDKTRIDLSYVDQYCDVVEEDSRKKDS